MITSAKNVLKLFLLKYWRFSQSMSIIINSIVSSSMGSQWFRRYWSQNKNNTMININTVVIEWISDSSESVLCIYSRPLVSGSEGPAVLQLTSVSMLRYCRFRARRVGWFARDCSQFTNVTQLRIHKSFVNNQSNNRNLVIIISCGTAVYRHHSLGLSSLRWVWALGS